ncbi:DUF397 domain-containing protein [Spirillospora sp. NPDC052269]
MVEWRKSSHSASSGQEDCVELARMTDGVGIRDSQNPSAGHLRIEFTALAGLAIRLKDEERGEG